METRYSSNTDIKDLRQSIDRNVNSCLCLLDTETGAVTELTSFDYLIEAPLFRGKDKIIYNLKGLIYSYDIKEKQITQMDTGYCIYCNNDHVLSADGTRLAVSHFTQEDIASRIYLINLEEKTPPFLVTPHAPSYLHGFSPDGKYLAYCALRNGQYDIYSIPADGGVETQLTDGPGRNDGPEYSADGKSIYFNSERNGFMDCYRMNPDGSNDRTLLKLFGGQGTMNVNSWNPDSRCIAFVKYIV